MSAFNRFDVFLADAFNKKHNLASDQLKLALTNTAPVAGNSVLADIVEIAYTNLSTRNVTTTSSTQTAGLYKLVCADLVMTSSGGQTGPFRYVVIYNSTAAGGPLIGWWDKGQSITLDDGESVTEDFAGDSTNVVFQAS